MSLVNTTDATEEDLEAARKFANACMDKALKHEI